MKAAGVLLEENSYTVEEGATIVTLKSSYLNTLSVGSHAIIIIWTDGDASTTFHIAEKTETSGNTKDPENIGVWMLFSMVVCVGMATIYNEVF